MKFNKLYKLLIVEKKKKGLIDIDFKEKEKPEIDPETGKPKPDQKSFDILNWGVVMNKIIDKSQDKYAIEISLKGDKTDETKGFVDSYDSEKDVTEAFEELNTPGEVLNYMELHSKNAPNADAFKWQALIKLAKEEIKKLPQKEIDALNLVKSLDVKSEQQPAEQFMDKGDEATSEEDTPDTASDDAGGPPTE
jgi:hypothetical protein